MNCPSASNTRAVSSWSEEGVCSDGGGVEDASDVGLLVRFIVFMYCCSDASISRWKSVAFALLEVNHFVRRA